MSIETLDNEPVRMYETLVLVLSKKMGELSKQVDELITEQERQKVEIKALRRKTNELETATEWNQHIHELELRGEL